MEEPQRRGNGGGGVFGGLFCCHIMDLQSSLNRRTWDSPTPPFRGRSRFQLPTQEGPSPGMGRVQKGGLNPVPSYTPFPQGVYGEILNRSRSQLSQKYFLSDLETIFYRHLIPKGNWTFLAVFSPRLWKCSTFHPKNWSFFSSSATYFLTSMLKLQ